LKRKAGEVDDNNNAINSVSPSIKRFHRIQVDENIAFSNSKLADNSFGSKGETWGGEANRILGAVKGDKFRSEKTKKKRGSYKGHGINMSINSVPLSDDDSL
jgi:hypothetical protein